MKEYTFQDDENGSILSTPEAHAWLLNQSKSLEAERDELLDAMKSLLGKVEHYLGPCLAGGEMTAARAAIAKAEGR